MFENCLKRKNEQNEGTANPIRSTSIRFDWIHQSVFFKQTRICIFAAKATHRNETTNAKRRIGGKNDHKKRAFNFKSLLHQTKCTPYGATTHTFQCRASKRNIVSATKERQRNENLKKQKIPLFFVLWVSFNRLSMKTLNEHRSTVRMKQKCNDSMNTA